MRSTSPRLGERDRDYVVEVDDLYHSDEGQTSGTADLTVIDPDNNSNATGNRQFTDKSFFTRRNAMLR